MSEKSLSTVYRRLDEIQHLEGNPKAHDLGSIIESITTFGFLDPLGLGDQDQTDIDGNGRLDALRTMYHEGMQAPQGIIIDPKDGMWMVPTVDGIDWLDKDMRMAAAIALNRTNERGGWTVPLLAAALQQLSQKDRMRGTGYDQADLADLLAQLEPPEPEGVDPGPALDKAQELKVKWKTAPGQLWILGEHRLICGDATDPETVKRLLQEDQVDQLITDPPYGVDYAGKNEFLNAYDKGTRVQTPIENDDEATIKDYREFFYNFLSLIPFAESNTAYVFMQGKHYPELATAFEQAGMYTSEDLVWVKNNHVLGRQDYSHKHELILYGWKGKHIFYRGFSTTVIDEDMDVDKMKKEDLVEIVKEFKAHFLTVIRADKPLASIYHPTTKPLELIEKFMLDGSFLGAIIYDPFVGSGTGLIAAQRLARRCRAVELDPAYCAVTIERWAAMTGQTPRLAE